MGAQDKLFKKCEEQMVEQNRSAYDPEGAVAASTRRSEMADDAQKWQEDLGRNPTPRGKPKDFGPESHPLP